MNIFIAYGLFEGPLFGRALRRELLRRGHTIAMSPSEADLVIAHSGAWCMLDQSYHYNKLVLVDPAYRDETSVWVKSLRRLGYDARHLKWHELPRYVYRRSLNLWYLVTRFNYWLRMKKRYDILDIVPLISRPNTYVLEASDPAWHNRTIIQRAEQPIRTLPGDHDSIWHKPDELAALLDL